MNWHGATWVAACIGLWVLFFAALDIWEQWQNRRRPVRGADGVWRAPQRPRNGRGRA